MRFMSESFRLLDMREGRDYSRVTAEGLVLPSRKVRPAWNSRNDTSGSTRTRLDGRLWLDREPVAAELELTDDDQLVV
jgi:hypothetical protein